MSGLLVFRTKSTALLIAILVGVMSQGTAVQEREVPSLLTDRDGQALWVSAERVVDEGPELLRRLNDPLRFQAGWLLNALIDPPTGRSGLPGRNDCLQLIEPAGFAGGIDFDEAVLSSAEILVGTVVDAAKGLAWGSPQFLLVVQVDKWLKRPTETPAYEWIYVTHQPGEVEIAGVKACRPRGEELAPAPPAGARVLAMFYRGPFLYTADDEPLFSGGYMLTYDGLQDGQPTLMASDALLRGSPEWLVDATVAELAERVDRILASPDGFVASEEPSPSPTPANRGDPAAERGNAAAGEDTRRPDPPDPCLRTEQCLVTPLILAGDVFSPLTNSFADSTTLFDIDADGRPERTAWLGVDPRDAFLWMDLNGNGAVDGAHEFVGAPGTDPRDEPAAIESSFEILALYDEPPFGGNGDGRIDDHDRVWARLLTWADRNLDGISQPDEIAPAGASALYFDVAYELVDEWDGSLNRVLGLGLYWIRGLRRDLRPRQVSELALRFR